VITVVGPRGKAPARLMAERHSLRHSLETPGQISLAKHRVPASFDVAFK